MSIIMEHFAFYATKMHELLKGLDVANDINTRLDVRNDIHQLEKEMEQKLWDLEPTLSTELMEIITKELRSLAETKQHIIEKAAARDRVSALKFELSEALDHEEGEIVSLKKTISNQQIKIMEQRQELSALKEMVESTKDSNSDYTTLRKEYSRVLDDRQELLEEIRKRDSRILELVRLSQEQRATRSRRRSSDSRLVAKKEMLKLQINAAQQELIWTKENKEKIEKLQLENGENMNQETKKKLIRIRQETEHHLAQIADDEQIGVDINAEYDALRDTVMQSDEEMLLLREEVEGLRGILCVKDEETSALWAKVKRAETAMNQKEGELDLFRVELKEKVNLQEATLEENMRMKQEVQRLNDQLNQKKGELDLFRVEVTEKVKSQEATLEENMRMKQEIQRLNDELKQRTQEVNETKSVTKSFNGFSSTTSEEQDAKLQDLRQSLTAKDKETSALWARVGLVESALKQRETEMDLANIEVKEKVDLLEAALQENTKLKGEIRQLEHSLNEKTREINEMIEENRRRRSLEEQELQDAELKDLRQILMAKDEETVRLSDVMEQNTNAFNASQREMASLWTELTEKRHSLQSARSENTRLKKALDRTTHGINGLKIKTQRISKELAATLQNHSGCQGKNVALEDLVNDLREKLHGREIEHQILIDAQENRDEKSLQQLQSLKAQITMRDTKLEHLRKRLHRERDRHAHRALKCTESGVQTDAVIDGSAGGGNGDDIGSIESQVIMEQRQECRESGVQTDVVIDDNDVGGIESEVNELRDKVAKCESTVVELNTKLFAKKEQIKSKKLEIARLNLELRDGEQQRQSTDELERRNLQSQAHLRDELEESQRKLMKLESKYKDLKGKLKASTSNCRKLRIHSEKLSKELKRTVKAKKMSFLQKNGWRLFAVLVTFLMALYAVISIQAPGYLERKISNYVDIIAVKMDHYLLGDGSYPALRKLIEDQRIEMDKQREQIVGWKSRGAFMNVITNHLRERLSARDEVLEKENDGRIGKQSESKTDRVNVDGLRLQFQELHDGLQMNQLMIDQKAKALKEMKIEVDNVAETDTVIGLAKQDESVHGETDDVHAVSHEESLVDRDSESISWIDVFGVMTFSVLSAVVSWKVCDTGVMENIKSPIISISARDIMNAMGTMRNKRKKWRRKHKVGRLSSRWSE